MDKTGNKFDIDWSYSIASEKTAIYIKKKKSIEKNNFSYKTKISAKNKKSPSTKYKFIYGSFFLSLFIVLFFLSISISSASNLKEVESDKGSSEDFFFDEYPERFLENLIFEESNENEDSVTIEGTDVLKNKKIEYLKYRVKNNDNIDIIAKKYNLKPDTIILANGLKRKRNLIAGVMLEIPNQDGRVIRVTKNDSIFKIAKRYGVVWEDITDVNNLETSVIVVGQKLFVPNSTLTSFEKNEYFGDEYHWPLNSRQITSKFGPRSDPITGVTDFHTGLDIKDKLGSEVRAIKDGVVSYIGFNKIYGNYVEVKHNSDMISIYAHLNRVTVKKGSKVNQGEQIGKVGSTGRSTGPHLHLEIRKNGKLVDPLKIM